MSTHKTFARKKPTETYAPRNKEFNASTGSRRVPGDSIDKYKDIEEVNIGMAEKELRQQNENNSLR
ncbi:hypothetical protein [Salipaludibacillus daqingensis]|uniref:hypothetical protein n=1 Tax=Salipaludibacillus daqingensis TaxID=3041001 RepID=UPI0024735D5A|nr:hypothetical protein [Salipaludibacillus daqingensis]